MEEKKNIICGTCDHMRSEYENGQLIHFCRKNHWVDEPERDGSNNECEDYKQG